MLGLCLGPTAQIYGDGVESSGETLDVFFHDRGNIPPARNENHSFKRGKSASYLWIGTAQLEQVKELDVDEVENLPPMDEEVVLMGTKREIYCPPVRCIEALRANGPAEKNAYAMKSAFKTAFKNNEERQHALKALPPNTIQRRVSSNTKAVFKTTSLQGEHSHKQSE